MKKIISLSIILLFTITSCSSFFQVEKRHYRKGFYVHHSNQDATTFSSDSVSQTSAKNQVEKKTVSIEKQKEGLSIRKVDQVIDHNPIKTVKGKIAGLINKTKSGSLISVIRKINKQDVTDDGGNRATRISRIFGIAALVLIVLGLILIEVTAIGLTPLVIGFFCGLFGLQFGRKALNYAPKKRKGETDADAAANGEKRKKAKKAYLLNLLTLLFLFAYLLFRFGIVLSSGAIGIAVLLFVMCLILFITFKLGWYRDL